MKLKDLLEKYGEYEVDLKTVVGKAEIESVTIDLTKPKQKSVWELKDGDPYVLLGDDGYITTLETHWSTGLTKNHINGGNAFLTINEAENERERRRVETLLLKHGGRRWLEHGHMNYFIEYDRKPNKLDVVCTGRFLWQGLIYFDTREQAEKAIQEIGEQRIINALFEVR